MGSPGRQRGRRSGRAGGPGDKGTPPGCPWGAGGCGALSLLPLPEEEGEEEGEEGSRASSGPRAPSCGVRAALRLLGSGRTFPPSTGFSLRGEFTLGSPLLLPARPRRFPPRFPGKGRGVGAVPGGLLHGLAPTRSNARASLAHSSFVLRADPRDQEGPFTAPVPLWILKPAEN